MTTMFCHTDSESDHLSASSCAYFISSFYVGKVLPPYFMARAVVAIIITGGSPSFSAVELPISTCSVHFSH